MVFSTVFVLIDYLQKNNVAHNIYVTRALNKDLNTSDIDARNCVRVFIWARTWSGKLYYTKSFISYYELVLKKF